MNAINLKLSYLNVDDVVNESIKIFGVVLSESMSKLNTVQTIELEHCDICLVYHYSFIAFELTPHSGHESKIAFLLLKLHDTVTY